MIRITALDAYSVNLSDGKGTQVLTAEQVEELISDRIGTVVDTMGLEIRDKLAVHGAILRNLAYLKHTYDIQMEFEDAKHDHLQDT